MGIILLIFFTGCFHNTITSVNHLRVAQLAFNESASLENKSRMGTLDPFAARDMRSVRSEVENTIMIQNGYASALLSINKIYPSEKKQLKSDKILGNILFLKAIVQWRIGDYEKALNTANEAYKEAGDQLFPRDTAVLAALPGLIKTDLAFKRIKKMKKETKERKLEIFKDEISPRLNAEGHGAVHDIMLARKKVNKEHEVNLYLIQAQLGAYRNYQLAYQLAHDKHSPDNRDKSKIAAQYNLQDLKDLLVALKKTEEVFDYWKSLCTIKPKPR